MPLGLLGGELVFLRVWRGSGAGVLGFVGLEVPYIGEGEHRSRGLFLFQVSGSGDMGFWEWGQTL
jgi:hypothetical protein